MYTFDYTQYYYTRGRVSEIFKYIKIFMHRYTV